MQNNSFHQDVSNCLSDYTAFKILEPDLQEEAFCLLEEEQMKLQGKSVQGAMSITYSRRPDLFDSFRESQQKPFLLSGEDNSFFCAINSMDIYSFGEKESVLYTSDLRLSSKATIAIKKGFRPLYKRVISCMDRSCYTVVLKENQRAIKALTRGKGSFFYNEYCPYFSISMVVSPILYLKSLLQKQKKINKEICFENIKSLPSEFLNKELKKYQFCHEINLDDENFVAKHNGTIIGFFGIKRPLKRSLYVKGDSLLFQMQMKLIKLFTGHNYQKKMPWVYLTNRIIDSSYNEKEILEVFITYLYNQKKLRNGELLLMCFIQKKIKKLNLMSLQVITEAMLYEVSLQNTKHELNGKIYLNPLCL
jgi:hypothetical protein